MTSVHSTYGQHERTESVKCAVFQFISVIQTFFFFALTLQPGGVILFSADDVSAAKTAEESRVPTHEV